MSRERLAGAVILLAGLYIFFQPVRDSPWSCLNTGITFCGWLPAFVIGSIVSAGLLIFGVWLLGTSRASSSARSRGIVAMATFAVVAGLLAVNFGRGPLGPFQSPVPLQTAGPARIAPPPTR